MDMFLLHERVDRAADGAEGRKGTWHVAIARECDDAGVTEVLGEAGGGAEELAECTCMRNA